MQQFGAGIVDLSLVFLFIVFFVDSLQNRATKHKNTFFIVEKNVVFTSKHPIKLVYCIYKLICLTVPCQTHAHTSAGIWADLNFTYT